MYNRNGSPKTSRRKPGSRAVSKKVVERDATVSMPGIKYDRASRLFDSAFALESELVNDVASEEEDELGKESEKPVAVVVADPHISSNGEEVASLDVGCSKQHIFSSQNSLLPSSSGAVDSDDRYFDKLDKSANRAHRNSRTRATSKKAVGHDVNVPTVDIPFDRASKLFDAAFALESKMDGDSGSDEEEERGHESETPVATVVGDGSISFHSEEPAPSGVGYTEQQMLFSRQTSLSPSSSSAVDSDDRYSPELGIDPLPISRNVATKDQEQTFSSQGSLTLAVQQFQLVSPASNNRSNALPESSSSSSPKRRQKGDKWKKKKFRGDEDEYDEDSPNSESKSDVEKCEKNMASGKGMASTRVPEEVQQKEKLREACVSEVCTPKDSVPTNPSQLPQISEIASGDGDAKNIPHVEVGRTGSSVHLHMTRANGKVMCRKSEKRYFTVIHNVQQAYQCRQSGETQEFADDVEYLLETMSDASVTVKCLSTLSLLNKCVSSPFRTYLKAHDHVNRFLQILKDSSTDKSLALCTAAFVYMLARDRLSIGINSQSLSVIVELLNFPNDALHDDSDCYGDYGIHRNGVWQALCSWLKEVQRHMGENQRMMFDFTEENLSASFLSMEALVFISSRMQSSWFKRELRLCGGLDRVALLFCNTVEELLKPDLTNPLSLLKVLQRPLRILENVTIKERENQTRLVSFEGLNFMNSLLRWFNWALNLVRKLSPVKPCSSVEERANMDPSTSADFLVCIEDLKFLLRLLCNLSNNNDLCCTRLSETSAFLNSCLECITFLIPQFIPCTERYDFQVLFLSLLINMAELRDKCRGIIIDCEVLLWQENRSSSSLVGSVEALCKIFCWHLANAAVADQEVDQEIMNSQQSSMTAGEVSFSVIEESVQSALSKAGRHMEEHTLASNAALLLGLLVLEREASYNLSEQIKALMPDESFRPLVDTLEKFLEFLKLTKIADEIALRAITRVIETFKILE